MPIDDSSKLHQEAEVLLRQVIPQWIEDGRPSSAAFSPNSGDEGSLSVDRNSIVEPKAAFEAYLARKRMSGGVWGLSVGECQSEDLKCYEDELPDNGAHALVHFGEASKSAQKRIGARLREKAHSRGCLYAPSMEG